MVLHYPPRFCPRRDWQERRAAPFDLSEGRTYEAWHPFIREDYQGPPEFDGEDYQAAPIVATWRPGWRYEPSGPEDCEEVWDGEGEQLRTIISIHKPGRYPVRVFYVRQWRDPGGKVFGKTGLRNVVASAFRVWVRGERWPHYAPARAAHIRWATTPFDVQKAMQSPSLQEDRS